MMKHVVRKLYVNWEKEEKWLNEMAAKGLALTDYMWCRYVFEETEPGAYVYRIDLLDHLPSRPQSRKYIEFLEEAGIEFVSSYMRWVYFRKKADGQPFALYSDISSQIARNKRVRLLWLPLCFAELAIGFSNILMGLKHPYAIVNLFLGMLCVGLGIMLGLLSIQVTRKIRALEKEQLISEA